MGHSFREVLSVETKRYHIGMARPIKGANAAVSGRGRRDFGEKDDGK